jgi:hypothetical protein
MKTASPAPTGFGLRRRLLSPKEIYRVYGISPAYLRSIATKELPRFRIGHRTTMYAVDALERYLASKQLR